ncbi:MAG: twin-arginine translocation pathway signal protein [Alphaproteobacteria bacterium]|nr:twin-arginine translocation pathway signal protein [Alphaproteobacteria bacterium]
MLWPDLDRLLPATDPFSRQITLGCGAFLELFDLAARAQGRTAIITPWPEGEPQPNLDTRPFAHIALTDAPAQRDGLFDHIPARRTNREAYGPDAPPDSALTGIRDDAALSEGLSIGWSSSGQLLQDLRTLAWEAFDIEMTTPEAYMESVNLMRIGAADIARHRDGLTLKGPMIEIARTLGLLNKTTLADLDNPFTKSGIEAFKPLAEQAPAYLWLTSADNSRTMQLRAGRAYARINLAATARGLAMHPWSQSLQEYPEQAEKLALAERLMNAPGDARVQMFVRIGVGKTIGPSPRRGLSEHLRAA